MKLMECAIYDLLQNEPYYAHFILSSRIVYDPKGLPTAAVGIVNATPTFLFNTDWLGTKTREQVVSILKHEVLHLVMDHHGRLNDRDKNLYNIAADCAINQHIQNLPDEGIKLDKLSKLIGKTLLPFESADYYYSELYAKAEKIPMAGNGAPKTLDEHNFPIEGDETNSELRKLAVKSASDQAVRSTAGNVPTSLLKVLGELNAEAKLNWKQLLRNFVATSTSNLRIHTAKKIHRRLGIEHPGIKKKRLLKLGVCLDDSGSMSDNQIVEILTEVQAIAKTNDVLLVFADCEVNHVEKLDSRSKIKPARHGNGGTAYQPAIDKCMEHNCTAIIYAGDMDTADVPKNPGVPFLWLTVGSETKPGDFGRMVKLA